MSQMCGKAKRRRIASSETTTTRNQNNNEEDDVGKLRVLLEARNWEAAMSRVSSHAWEAATSQNPSPLALACRFGAPVECVRAILNACPSKVRHMIDARGTPIHEAIVCEHVGASVIQVLLEADERKELLEKEAEGTQQHEKGNTSTRATLLQDVDGFTPLHLLIRRRFQAHILHDEGANLMQILEMMVRSCPEAVLIPDRGEYEEPPIIYALKADIYAPALVSDDDTIARVERQIYEMVACMLKYCPAAAGQVFSGYRGQYTALHSAVFHGRNTDTVQLLLATECRTKNQQEQREGGGPQPQSSNCVLANTQGEVPLHFCAMRGERPRSVALIAQAAPQAVLKRDATGLTPLHWLWARFVSSLLALDRAGFGDDTTVEPLRIVRDSEDKAILYCAFASLEQGDFELDLQLIKQVDPPVDFLRMRHIPIDVLGPSDSLQWADLTVQLLQDLRERYHSSNGQEAHIWSRRECVVSLFWTKVVSLIQESIVAIVAADHHQPSCSSRTTAPRGDSILVHSAFCSPACSVAICRIVASLYPGELVAPDERGRLPLHYAASRAFHEFDWPSSCDSRGEISAAATLLREETLHVIHAAIECSPSQAFAVTDHEGRLPLHDFIDNICSTASSRLPSFQDIVCKLLRLLDRFLEQNQLALQCRDGRSQLYPFLQAAAMASHQPHHQQQPTHQHHTSSDSSYDHLTLSITYRLLRENPAAVIQLRQSC